MIYEGASFCNSIAIFRILNSSFQTALGVIFLINDLLTAFCHARKAQMVEPLCMVFGELILHSGTTRLMVFATFVKELELHFLLCCLIIAWRLEFVAEPMNFL